MLYGSELPNVPDISSDAWGKLMLLDGQVVKMRGYHGLAAVDTALDLWPGATILLRRNADGLIDPRGQLEEARPIVRRIKKRGGFCIYVLDNEPNHPDSPYRYVGVQHYAQDLGQLVLAMDELEVPLCSPPMAPQNRDLDLLSYLEPHYQGWGLEYRGAHLYWQWDQHQALEWGRRLEQYAAICPGATWIIDELGDATPEGEATAEQRATRCLDVLLWLRARRDVHAATLFLGAGGTDEWRRYFLSNAGLIAIHEGLRELTVVPTPPEEEIVIDKDAILAALDDCWGALDRLNEQAEQVKAEAARIRHQIVTIKQAAGLDVAGPKA